MTSPEQQQPTASGPRVVVIGTGGTIAGTARSCADHVGYQAAQLGVAELLADLAELVSGVPALADTALEAVQVAQLDSKDMSHAVWQRLVQEVARQLARDEVVGVVVTHGTDTLEETGYLLQRVLATHKPVVLTAAMRPATALMPDGPQNLLDALTLAALPDAQGVLAVLAGQVLAGAELRKQHTYRLDAFGGGDAGPIGVIEQGRLRRFRPWPGSEPQAPAPFGVALLQADPAQWPRVALLSSHAGLDEALVGAQLDAWCARGLAGLVVAGTGNGTLHVALEPALRRAAAAGVRVWRASRCAAGAVIDPAPESATMAWPGTGSCSAVQARIELMLQLLRDHSFREVT